MTPQPVPPPTMRCSLCGSEFGCNPSGACWCKDEDYRLPMPLDPAAGCLCPSCLRAAAGRAARPAS